MNDGNWYDPFYETSKQLQAIEKFQEGFGKGDISESLGSGAETFKKAIESLPMGDEVRTRSNE